MANWVIKASEQWLQPLYNKLKENLVKEVVLYADETTLQVLKTKEHPTPKKCYMWLYRTSGCTSNPIVLYDYQPNRKAENPENFLKGFKVYLHTDGFKGYRHIPGAIIVGCHAHSRRRFTEAVEVIPKAERNGSIAEKGLDYCNHFFAIEREIEDMSFEDKLKERQNRAKSVLDALFAWAKKIYLDIAPKSKLGKALYYLINEEPYLRRYIEDGRLEMTNSREKHKTICFVKKELPVC